MMINTRNALLITWKKHLDLVLMVACVVAAICAVIKDREMTALTVKNEAARELLLKSLPDSIAEAEGFEAGGLANYDECMKSVRADCSQFMERALQARKMANSQRNTLADLRRR